MDFCFIPYASLDGRPVKVTVSGSTVEIVQSNIAPPGALPIKKLDKFHYMDINTGEVFEYDLSGKKDDKQSLKRTIHKIRNLINHNFYIGDTMITLTYAQPDGKPMTDTVRLYEDMHSYIKRLKRRIPALSYLYVVEPQETGSWHVHMLLKGSHDIDYISLWPHGEPWCQSVEILSGEITNIGAYLSAYLTNLKKGKKGDRLKFYPPGMNIYRCSRNIKMPPTLELSAAQAKTIVGDREADFQQTVIVSDEGKPYNVIKRMYYNIKPPQTQATGSITDKEIEVIVKVCMK